MTKCIHGLSTSPSCKDPDNICLTCISPTGNSKMTLDEIRSLPGGAILQDATYRYYVVLEENEFYHAKPGTLVDLFYGNIRDCTWLKMPVKQIQMTEIMF